MPHAGPIAAEGGEGTCTACASNSEMGAPVAQGGCRDSTELPRPAPPGPVPVSLLPSLASNLSLYLVAVWGSGLLPGPCSACLSSMVRSGWSSSVPPYRMPVTSGPLGKSEVVTSEQDFQAEPPGPARHCGVAIKYSHRAARKREGPASPPASLQATWQASPVGEPVQGQRDHHLTLPLGRKAGGIAKSRVNGGVGGTP